MYMVMVMYFRILCTVWCKLYFLIFDVLTYHLGYSTIMKTLARQNIKIGNLNSF